MKEQLEIAIQRANKLEEDFILVSAERDQARQLAEEREL
jgi:hypothetical protein